MSGDARDRRPLPNTLQAKPGEGALRPFPHLQWGKVGMGAGAAQSDDPGGEHLLQLGVKHVREGVVSVIGRVQFVVP